MRKLNLGDIFNAARLIKAIDAPDKVRDYIKGVGTVIDKGKSEDDVTEYGIGIVLDMMNTAASPIVEMALYRFLAGPAEMSPDGIKALELSQVVDLVKQLAKENDLRDFFGEAAKLRAKL